MKSIKLNDRVSIPVLGLGTWKLTGNRGQEAVGKALEIGYRHIDTAEAYYNQKEIGRAILASGIPRQDIFLTSKVIFTNLGKDSLRKACEKTLSELQTDYLNLYLIHWPNPTIPLSDTLGTMNKLQEEGLIHAVGVSNFTISHLTEALKVGVEISVNQVEFHPSLNQKTLKEFCDLNKILITAYSPIAQGEDLKLDVIKLLAQKYGRSESQVILSWIIQKGMVAIPRSLRSEHLLDNFRALDLNLSPKDIDEIDNIDRFHRLINPFFADFED